MGPEDWATRRQGATAGKRGANVEGGGSPGGGCSCAFSQSFPTFFPDRMDGDEQLRSKDRGLQGAPSDPGTSSPLYSPQPILKSSLQNTRARGIQAGGLLFIRMVGLSAGVRVGGSAGDPAEPASSGHNLDDE